MELIKITEKPIGQQVVKTVKARELSAALGVSKTNVSKWLSSNIEQNQFAMQGIDFIEVVGSTNSNGVAISDYILSLDFAKRIAMMTRTSRGEEVRNYFIECERIAKEASTPALPTNYLDALKALVASEETKAQLLLESAAKDALIEQQKPAVEFVDSYVDSRGLMGIREAGKVLGIPQNTFVNILLDKKILFRSRGDLVPYSEWQKKGYMVVKTNTYNDVMTKRTFFTPSGINWLSNLLG